MLISDAYRTLGVQINVSDSDLKKKYRVMVQRTHPDKGGSAKDFIKIQQSYEIIMKHREMVRLEKKNSGRKFFHIDWFNFK